MEDAPSLHMDNTRMELYELDDGDSGTGTHHKLPKDRLFEN